MVDSQFDKLLSTAPAASDLAERSDCNTSAEGLYPKNLADLLVRFVNPLPGQYQERS